MSVPSSPPRRPVRGVTLCALASVTVMMFALAVSAQRMTTLEPLDGSGRVTYFIAEGIAGSQYRPSDRDLATWALKAWEHSVAGALRFDASPEDEALVRIYWVPANAGQYGEMRPLTVSGRRGAAVFIRADTDALGGEMARLARMDPLLRETIVYLTCVHELGHALGLEHTADFRDIMYFFGYGGDIPGFFNRYRVQLKRREDISGVSGISEGDIARLLVLYGKNGTPRGTDAR